MSLMEWIGFITGVICVALIVIERDINWPIGVLNSLALLWVFWTQKLYAQAGLQVFYVVECLYGWWKWTRRDNEGHKLVRIGRTKTQMAIYLSSIGVVSTLALWWLFSKTGDPAPFWDSVITVASLIAEYMLCLKLFEAWGIYLASDFIAIAVLLQAGAYVTAGTYGCFTVLCILGIIEWVRRYKKSSTPALSLASSTL